MTKEELSTRDKILTTAHRLFSEKGFNGVGVREIAKEADANVAAINYHFGNKDKLYSETIKASMQKMEADIINVHKSLGDNSSVENLAASMYDYYVENKDDLLTGFKLFLSSGDADQDEFTDVGNEIGPPGGHVLFEVFKNQIPEAKEEDIIWAVRTIFTQVIHKAVIVCNHCEMVTKMNINADGFKNDILRLVKIVVQEVKQSS